MPTSLAKLVENLNKPNCRNLASSFKNEKFDLLLRKGIYPYDYMDNLEKFNETSLLPKEKFYSKLNDSNISDSDYAHAKKVWEILEMSTMRDYHDLYLKTDVLLLADVFEHFRTVCLENYKLDPAWYYTSPGLSWDAMLKLTKVKLELLHDYDMLLMIEKGIRGGISSVITRHGSANNSYMSNYDLTKPTKFISYLDANNLYGYAMSKKLPTQ